VKKAWKNRFGTELMLSDVTPSQIERVVQLNPDLAGDIQRVTGDLPVFRRLNRVKEFITGARILWIDDHPENNS